MRLLITGGQGQLGRELQRLPARDKFQFFILTRAELDITNKKQISDSIETFSPNIVINTAAYTQVDKAEQESEKAYAVNAEGSGLLAEACAKANIPLIHFSTDYVFFGDQQSPYQENSIAKPINTYGASKLAGENAIADTWSKHLIVRTSGVFSSHGHNFVKTILRLANEKEILSIVNDQIICPTAAADLAVITMKLCEKILLEKKEKWGIYHYSSKDPISWFDFASSIVKLVRAKQPLKVKNINTISSAEYITLAKRPAYSVLNCDKIKTTFGIEQSPWHVALEKVVNELIVKTI